jgi:predicted DNA-binding transcriptional regulator AlpA
MKVDPLLSPNRTAELVGLARKTLCDLTRAGKFPKPIKLTPTRTAYSSAEIAQWIEARKNERGSEVMSRVSAMGVEAKRRKREAAGG